MGGDEGQVLLTSWSANQLKFQEWLATPRFDRIPPTQELLAGELGVHEVTLSRWRRLPGFTEAVNALAREALGARLPDVYGALVRRAETGDVPAIRTILELVGELKQGDSNGAGTTNNNNIIIVYEGGGAADPPYPSSWTLDGVVTAPAVQRGLLRAPVGENSSR